MLSMSDRDIWLKSDDQLALTDVEYKPFWELDCPEYKILGAAWKNTEFWQYQNEEGTPMPPLSPITDLSDESFSRAELECLDHERVEFSWSILGVLDINEPALTEKKKTAQFFTPTEEYNNRQTLPVMLPVRRRPHSSHTAVQSSGQLVCCMKGCESKVKNRLRFSLRMVDDNDFKVDFLRKQWNRVCHRHYFAGMYFPTTTVSQ